MNDILRVGLIGAGRIGRVHAENIAFHLPEATLIAVADINAEAAHAVATRCHVPRVTADYREIIADAGIDAVLVCSATNTHAHMIEQAAAAGKHIFCEKPIALNLADIDRALAAVDVAGVTFQLGFNRRFDANFLRVHRAVHSGEIGRPHLLHIVSRDPAPPPLSYIKVSGGIFLDMTVHDFDMARFLIEDEVEEVYAQVGVMVDPAIGQAGDVDTAVTMLRFANGVIGTIDNSRQAVYGYDQRVEVFGSAGTIATENVFPNSATLSTADAIQRDLPLNFFMQRYTESYLVEVAQFVDAVRHVRLPPVGGRDGRAAFLIGLAAARSARERRPVKVKEVAQ
jgi:myo-inositol 2-dehydrogenase/D-chiro-inositol 1-dehydrogenase